MNLMLGELTMKDRTYFWNVARRIRIDSINDSRFTPAEHYFDNQDNEIAMIYSPKTNKEKIIIFDPPRCWPQEFKDMYISTEIKEETMFPAPAVEVELEMKLITDLTNIKETPGMDKASTWEEDAIDSEDEEMKRELIDVDKSVTTFWENCPENFAHLKIHGHLGNIKNLTAIWNSSFIEVLNNFHPIKDSIIIDYGTGGGYLGIHLHKRFSLKSYIGIDIAKRQRDGARDNLVRMNQTSSKAELPIYLLEPGCHFSEFSADFFISLACMQHFPSIEYLEDFLLNINDSGIKTIVLQYRYADETHITNKDYKEMLNVCFKCYTNADCISEILDNYSLEWISDKHGLTDEQYVIFQLMETD